MARYQAKIVIHIFTISTMCRQSALVKVDPQVKVIKCLFLTFGIKLSVIYKSGL